MRISDWSSDVCSSDLNAIFVVSGNFDPARLDAWADRYIGVIPRPTRAIPRDPAKGRPIAARTIDAYAPNVPLPALVFAWRAPFAADRDAAGIALMDAMLPRGAASRLRRNLFAEIGRAHVWHPVPNSHF